MAAVIWPVAASAQGERPPVGTAGKEGPAAAGTKVRARPKHFPPALQ